MTLEQAMQLAEQCAAEHGITWNPVLYLDFVNDTSFQRDTPEDTAHVKNAWRREAGTWHILVDTDATAPRGLLGFRVDDATGNVTLIVMPLFVRMTLPILWLHVWIAEKIAWFRSVFGKQRSSSNAR